ncbi:MAG: nicotinate-nucleotide adenylyltransferase [Pseudomonadota bacterium]
MLDCAAIGVLGGSFNPPHAGHRALVRYGMRRFGLGGAMVLVAPQNPLKSARDYAPLEDRLAATRTMMAGLPHVRVLPEARQAPVFAADTVRALVMRHPAKRFVYLMGADSFAGLERWDRWTMIMGMVPIGVVSRPGYKRAALRSLAARRFSQARLPERQAISLQNAQAPAWCFVGGLNEYSSSSEIRRDQNPL